MNPSNRVWTSALNPQALTEIEVASGIVVGQGNGPLFESDRRSDPLLVLREKAREALATPPCVVAFSGGRDSSALLAFLLDVARSDGLPEPIAVTARWDDDVASDESAWQEEVITTIGAHEWEIVRPGTDLDLLGDEARSVLQAHGLFWPAPAYALRPLFRLAKGGVLLSGEGGDEAFGLYPYGRLWQSVRARQLPRQIDLRALALGCLPRAVRRWRWRTIRPAYQTWLSDSALKETSTAMADDGADDPLRWGSYQVISRRRRAMDLTLGTLQMLAQMEGARYEGPFLDETFLAALGAWGGNFGRGDRGDVMTSLFANVLPGPILTRVSKASFGGVFWGPESRRFAEEWDGTGLPLDMINPDALRSAWLAPVPVYGAALPLQAAWLSSQKHQNP